jgi:hypothetical protein
MERLRDAYDDECEIGKILTVVAVETPNRTEFRASSTMDPIESVEVMRSALAALEAGLLAALDDLVGDDE